jgi:DNA-binding NtrC family response regulator
LLIPNILIIDDNPDIGKALSILYKLDGFKSFVTLTPEDGLQALSDSKFDLVIQDMNFSKDMTSGKEGIELFENIRKLYPDIPIIIITAWTNVETAVDLVKSGSADYIGKPWDDKKLLISTKNLLELSELQQDQSSLKLHKHREKNKLEDDYNLCNIRYQSESMFRLLQMATQVAHADVPVLISGPNGSGKEKIAEIIQANSSCKEGPFIKVNVGALSKELLEAELFGAEAGSYTGITKRRIGRFEAANNGTLFLDEIGNLSHDGQIKLLRVLQTGEFERIGSHQTIKVNVRVISATNADLKLAINEGSFREDLFYRLNVIELKLSALKYRKEDIVPLTSLFLQENYSFDDESRELLQQYHWPGNVRELQNVIKRAMLLTTTDVINKSSLDLDIELDKNISSQEELTKEEIEKALSEHDNNIAGTAKNLGLSRSALYRRLKKFSINY